MSTAMTQAEHTADRIRGELLRTLEELDRRRAALTDWRAQAKANRPVLFIALGALGAAAGAKIGWSFYERRRGSARMRQERVKALRRAWERPREVARPTERSAVATLALAVVGAFATAFAVQLARRAAGVVLQSGGTRAVGLGRKARLEVIPLPPV